MFNSLILNAVAILGTRRQRGELRLMAKALSVHPWLNNADDRLRLSAARQALAYWPEFVAACEAHTKAKHEAARKARLAQVDALVAPAHAALRRDALAIMNGEARA